MSQTSLEFQQFLAEYEPIITEDKIASQKRVDKALETLETPLAVAGITLAHLCLQIPSEVYYEQKDKLDDLFECLVRIEKELL